MEVKRIVILAILILGWGLLKSQNILLGGTVKVGWNDYTSIFPVSNELQVDFGNLYNLSIGMVMEKKITERGYIIVESVLVQSTGKKVENRIVDVQEQAVTIDGRIVGTARLHATAVQLPVSYGYQFGKLRLKGGMQAGIFVKTSVNYEAAGTLVVNTIPETLNIESKNPVKMGELDIGPKIGMDYVLSRRIRLGLDYYHGLTDITADVEGASRIGRFTFSNRTPIRNNKNRQLTVSLSYIFTDIWKPAGR